MTMDAEGCFYVGEEVSWLLFGVRYSVSRRVAASPNVPTQLGLAFKHGKSVGDSGAIVDGGLQKSGRRGIVYEVVA